MKEKNKFKVNLEREIEQRFDSWNAKMSYPFPRGRELYITLKQIMVKCAMTGYRYGKRAERAGVRDDDEDKEKSQVEDVRDVLKRIRKLKDE